MSTLFFIIGAIIHAKVLFLLDNITFLHKFCTLWPTNEHIISHLQHKYDHDYQQSTGGHYAHLGVCARRACP